MEAVKEVLNKVLSKLSSVLLGQDRINFIIDNLSLLKTEDIIVLRNFFNKMLSSMIESEASDIEFGGHGNGEMVWMRVHGKKERVKELPKMSADESALIILTLLSDNQRQFLSVTKSIDFSYSFFYPRKNSQFRFRATTYFEVDTLSLNMRAISSSVRSLESLEFHPSIMKALSHNFLKFGLTLITGITGSGKSATLDSIIDHHNKFDPAHIIIIASPLEFIHKSNTAIIKHREVGRDVQSFKDGVIQSLRQDPDIIVIGEMRDPDTIMAALEVTDTGHKVFSTLHTSSAVESIDRIIAEVHPSEQDRVRNRLADVLTTVVSQKLVPTVQGKLTLAKEVLLVTSSVKAAIKNNNTSEIYMMINQGSQNGMTTMEQDLKRLYLVKKISLDTAINFSNNKTRMQQILSAT